MTINRTVLIIVLIYLFYLVGAMGFPSTLRVAVLEKNGLFEVQKDEDGVLVINGGLDAEYIKTLSTSLRFKLDVVLTADGEWGRELSNGSWTGLVGMVLRNESDIALGGIAVTEKRYKIISYSSPYRFTYLTFATNLPRSLPRFTTFLYPFTMHLWIALAVLLFLMPFILRILLRRKITLGNLFFDTIKSLLYEPITSHNNDHLRDYFLQGAWLIAAMLISFSYAATLLSFLTIPLREPGVQNIKELSELVAQNKFRAGCFKGTNVVNILRADQHKSIQELADHIMDNKNDIEPDIGIVKKFYKSKKSALIAPEIYFKMNFANTLRISPEPVKCTAISMVMLKSFCCRRKLDAHINRMFNSGLSQQILKRTLTKIEINEYLKATYVEKDLTLNLKDLLGAFVFYLIGNALAAIALIAEILISKLHKRKRSKILRRQKKKSKRLF